MLAKIDAYITDNKRLSPDTVNLLRMMKLTGCGPAEIAGLTVADVSLSSEIPYIWIRDNGRRGFKTKVRERRIPLIGEALEAAGTP